jgi:HSP20 family protein
MTVIRWAPLSDFGVIQQHMDRLCAGYPEDENSEYLGFSPALEMVMTDRDIILYLDIPGVDPDRIDVQATAKTVTIMGERLSKVTAEATVHQSELRYGKFQRAIALPEKIQHDQVVAKYEQGVLQLVLPKLVEDKDKIVKVTITH